MRILYIGGTGRISYRCVQESLRLGHDVAVFNRGKSDNPLPDEVQRIRGDLNDRRAYAELGQRTWDVVCQFKAYDLDRIELDASTFSGKVGQYVFISSASAYIKPPGDWVVTEETPLGNPYWRYSQNKADMERRLMELHQAGTLPVTIVRPSHTNDRCFPGTFIAGEALAWRILHRRPVVVHGDGTSLWVMMHSIDFARPFCRLLGQKRALGEAFHITGDKAHTWNEILSAMCDALGAEPDLVRVPTETIVRYDQAWAGPLLGDKAWSVWFDNTKVKSVAGDFACEVTMPEMLREAASCADEILAGYEPDLPTHALIDRMAAKQRELGK